jgi:hypothetical protein
MKAAVQQAVRALDAELEAIKVKVRDHAIDVARRTLGKLHEMAPDLANQLQPVFKAEPKWDGFKLSLTGDDDIPINKRGSGVRRLILLNFFRAEAERKRSDRGDAGVIYAIEEPENSQHPNNQSLLIKALLELSEQTGTQVILTTHVPGIASMLPKDSVRFIIRAPDGHPDVAPNTDGIRSYVADELGILPDGRAKLLIYVEGPNDVTCLTHFARILRQSNPDLPDLATDPRIAFVVTGGGNLQHWVNQEYLKRLQCVEVHIFDRDENPAKYQAAIDEVNARGNRSWGCLTNRREMENYLHPRAIEEFYGFQIEVTPEADVPAMVAEAQHNRSGSEKSWADLCDKKRSKKISNAKRTLNEKVAAAMTLEDLRECDPQGEVLGWLREITARLEAIGGAQQPGGLVAPRDLIEDNAA